MIRNSQELLDFLSNKISYINKTDLDVLSANDRIIYNHLKEIQKISLEENAKHYLDSSKELRLQIHDDISETMMVHENYLGAEVGNRLHEVVLRYFFDIAVGFNDFNLNKDYFILPVDEFIILDMGDNHIKYSASLNPKVDFDIEGLKLFFDRLNLINESECIYAGNQTGNLPDIVFKLGNYLIVLNSTGYSLEELQNLGDWHVIVSRTNDLINNIQPLLV